MNNEFLKQLITFLLIVIVVFSLLGIASGAELETKGSGLGIEKSGIVASSVLTGTVPITLTEPIEPTVVPTVELTIEPTVTNTVEPTVEPTVDYGGDIYEVDSMQNPIAYIGAMNRSFSPTGDIDYVLFHVKQGVTEIRTDGLTGAADTYIEIRDQTGTILIASDDDSGNGLGSYLRLEMEHEADIVVVIRNKSAGFGSGVGYTIEIIPEQVFTPTPTLQPTATPRATSTLPPTQVPLPTYTPYPTATPLPATNTPIPRPVITGPVATPTPEVVLVLRVEVYTDGDKDGVLDISEGVQDVVVEIQTLDGQFSASGHTVDGVWIFEIECPPDGHELRNLEISIPYLQETQILNSLTDWEQVSFVMDAPILPIELP